MMTLSSRAWTRAVQCGGRPSTKSFIKSLVASLIWGCNLSRRSLEVKKHPILVNLKTTWDRRIIVYNARKLAESAEFRGSIYVSSDESLDVRRRNTLKRLKERYEFEMEVMVTAKDAIALLVLLAMMSNMTISDLSLQVVSYNCKSLSNFNKYFITLVCLSIIITVSSFSTRFLLVVSYST